MFLLSKTKFTVITVVFVWPVLWGLPCVALSSNKSRISTDYVAMHVNSNVLQLTHSVYVHG